MLSWRGIYGKTFRKRKERDGGCKNMLSQIIYYRHISPSLYTVSAEVGVASGIFHDIIVYIFYVIMKFR